MRLQGFGPERYLAGQLVKLEFRWRNLTQSGEPGIRCFLSYRVGSAVNIRMQKLRANPGDMLKLEEVKLYQPSDFARDFQSRRRETFSNIDLLCQGDDQLALQVDGKRFGLRAPRLSFFGQEVTLDAVIEPTTKEVRFRFDRNNATDMRFFKDKPIHGMSLGSHGLEIFYRSGPNDDRIFRIYLDKLDKNLLLGGMRLLSFPKIGTGHFHGEIDPPGRRVRQVEAGLVERHLHMVPREGRRLGGDSIPPAPDVWGMGGNRAPSFQ
jgi:hypothetical protein